jgi:small GTP-binding protein
MSKTEDDITIEEITSPITENIKEDLKLKLVLLGDSGVGKTNLISRYISNSFDENTRATIGVEFFCKNFRINKKRTIKVEIWDTAGQERYKAITSVYYKGAKGAFIVYDITSRKTFENIDKWIGEIKERTTDDVKLIIIGNKTDLNNEREVKSEEALIKYQDMDIPLIETSALEDTNVNEAFINLIKIVYKDIARKEIEERKSISDNKISQGIDLKSIDEEEINENKESFTCCLWS